MSSENQQPSEQAVVYHHPEHSHEIPRTHHKTPKLPLWALIAIIALALGLIACVLLLNFSNQRIKENESDEPREIVTGYEVVCGREIVDRYNNSLNVFDGTGDEVLAQLSSDITALNGYSDDPTCQTILFMNAWRTGDIEVMQSSISYIREAFDQNMFANSDLSSVLTFSQMESVAEQFSNLDNNPQPTE